MRRSTHKTYLPFLLLFLFPGLILHAQQGKGGGNGIAFSFGPVLGFYKLNNKHAVSPARRTSFILGFRREIKVDREYRTFIQFGAEYLVHGLGYKSYYFSQDTLQLYDKSFAYEYTLYTHEINVPVVLKVLFNRGDNKLFSPYACVGYHLRYLLQGNVHVRQYGNLVKKDFPEMKFRNFLFYEKMNAFVSAGLGWQRNKINARGSSFFAEVNFRYGFSDYYFERSYSASAVFINGTHLALLLGIKF